MDSISSILSMYTLSSVTRINQTETGYAVTNITHTETGGDITSTKSEYVIYDKSAGIQNDNTPKWGSHVDVRV